MTRYPKLFATVLFLIGGFIVISLSRPTRATAEPPARPISAADEQSIRPFQFKASDDALADLRQRIVATRWPDRETVADDSQGVRLATMQALAKYWAKDYDWRKIESKLNALPQFITTIDGLDI